MRTTLLFLCFATCIPVASGYAASIDQDDVIALEGVTVTATKQREMLARLIKVGLSNSRSERTADVDKIVCTLRKRTGSHFKDLLCASNGTLNYMRQTNMMRNQRVFGQVKSGSSGNYQAMGRAWGTAFGNEVVQTSTFGVVMTLERVTRAEIKKLINEFAADDNDVQNQDKLTRDMVWANFVPVDGRLGYSVDDYTNFAVAYRAIKLMESEIAADAVLPDAMLAAAIQKQGLSIEQYNAIFDAVLSDDELRMRVMIARNLGL